MRHAKRIAMATCMAETQTNLSKRDRCMASRYSNWKRFAGRLVEVDGAIASGVKIMQEFCLNVTGHTPDCSRQRTER